MPSAITMLSPTKKNDKDKKRKREEQIVPSENENNSPVISGQGFVSPTKILASPITSIKNLLWNPNIDEDDTTSPKQSKTGEETTPSFISSAQKKKAKASAVKTLHNLETDTKEQSDESCGESSSPDTRAEKKQNILNPLFSPVFTLFGHNKTHNIPQKPKSEQIEVIEDSQQDSVRNDLVSDEVLSEISNDTPVDKSITIYDPYHFDQEDEDQLEEFDPFLFIAHLPQPSEEQLNRPHSLPPKTSDTPKFTLVLDLDETLVHCSTEPLEAAELILPVLFDSIEYQVYVRKRPHFEEFLEKVSKEFEVVIFTASQEAYASKLLSCLDPQCKYIKYKLYRDSCVNIDGNYLKDLTILGRELSHVIIVDNSPQAFGYQLDNGIPIESWFDDSLDTELLKLIPFLEDLQKESDVRPAIRQKYNLMERVRQRLGMFVWSERLRMFNS